MFSYISQKNSDTNYESNLIEQIQSIANEIFDHHASSHSKTEHQQMSLELSPATSQDNFEIKRNDSNNQNQQENYFSQLRRRQSKDNIYFIDQSQKDDNIKHEQKQKGSYNRLSKSMIFGNNFKQPGSFSNKYTGGTNNNLSSSNVSHIKDKNNQFKDENQFNQTALKKSNLNKSNILMGILNQKNSQMLNKSQILRKSKSKSKSKTKLFSKTNNFNYVSPYSNKMIKQNPRSYMEKSYTSPFKKQKQTMQFRYIKQRINQNVQPQISYRKQKSQHQKVKNPKLANIKSKYKQYKPILHQYKLYVDEHIYKKTKQQMNVWQQKKKIISMRTPQEIQQTWERFIDNQQKLLEQKKQRILSMQLQKMHSQNTQHFVSPKKNIIMNSNKQKGKYLNSTKLTPQDFVKKYKRQKQKLKQKLQANQISNFMQRSNDDFKKMGSHAFESVWGSNLQKSNQKGLIVEGFSTIKVGDYSTIKQNSKINQFQLNNQKQNIENQGSCSIPHQNFFVSVQTENQYKNFKKNKSKLSTSREEKSLSKSSVYESYRKRSGKSYSTQRKTSINPFNLNKTSIQAISLSSFMKRNGIISASQEQRFMFDPKKHNSAIFNQKLVSSKSKQKPLIKSKLKSIQKVSELLNPKYFRSINQLQQYSSNSRQKLQKQKIKKTYQSQQIHYNDFIQNNHNFKQYQSHLSNNQSFKKYTPNKIKKNQTISISSYQNQINRVQSQIRNAQRKNVITKFDHNLMKKTIQDLQKMRLQIQQNKKKRKHAIQNYRNFSNIRIDDQQSSHNNSITQGNISKVNQVEINKNRLTNNFDSKYNNRLHHNQYEKDNKQSSINKRQNFMQRNTNTSQLNNRAYQRSKSPIQKQSSARIQLSQLGRQRSVSPIHQQDMSVSVINPINQSSYKNQNAVSSQISQFNSKLFNSNIIMVKNHQQIQFIMKNTFNEQQNSLSLPFSQIKYQSKY